MFSVSLLPSKWGCRCFQFSCFQRYR